MPATPTRTTAAARPTPYARRHSPTSSSSALGSVLAPATATQTAEAGTKSDASLLSEVQWSAMGPKERAELILSGIEIASLKLASLEGRRECGDALGRLLWPRLTEHMLGKKHSRALEQFGHWTGFDATAFAGKSGAFVLGEVVEFGLNKLKKRTS